MICSGAAFASKKREEMVQAAENASGLNGGQSIEANDLARSQLFMAKKWALAVVMKKACFVYDITFSLDRLGNSKITVKKLNQLSLDRSVSYAEIHDGRLILGHQASFVSYPIVASHTDVSLAHPISLVQSGDKTLHFLQTETALCSVPISRIIEVQNDNANSTSDNSSSQVQGDLFEMSYSWGGPVFGSKKAILGHFFVDFIKTT